MASIAPSIDFSEIATRHNVLRNARGGGRRVTQEKLTLITLKARHVVWSPERMSSKRVPVDANYGQTRYTSSSTLEDSTQVNILEGLCKGFSANVKVPFPEGAQGNRVLDVDPCKPGQSKSIKTPMELTSEAGGGEASVTAVVEKHTYEGNFSCRVYPWGKILLEATTQDGSSEYGEIKTQTVLEKLVKAGDSSVKDFDEDEQGYYFTMRGRCNLEFDTGYHHTWS